uniref:Uncharacterized protein n=1 Tax=Vespula pensylvanica TaxID=30213 RepID=A0A834NYV6_VESPE|nr:hypothetical protein H0235_009595 [Vespula pensylvanica]
MNEYSILTKPAVEGGLVDRGAYVVLSLQIEKRYEQVRTTAAAAAAAAVAAVVVVAVVAVAVASAILADEETKKEKEKAEEGFTAPTSDTRNTVTCSSERENKRVNGEEEEQRALRAYDESFSRRIVENRREERVAPRCVDGTRRARRRETGEVRQELRRQKYLSGNTEKEERGVRLERANETRDDACRPGGYDSDDDSGGGSCGGRGGEVGAGGGSANRSSSGGPREGSGSDGGDGDSDGDGRVDGRAGIRVDRPRKTLRTVNRNKKKQEREGRGEKEKCWSRKIENVREKGA